MSASYQGNFKKGTFSPSLIARIFAKINSWDRQLLKQGLKMELEFYNAGSDSIEEQQVCHSINFPTGSKLGIPRPALEDNSPINIKSSQQCHLPQWGDSTIQLWTIIHSFLLISSLNISFCRLSQQQLFLSSSIGKTIPLSVVFVKKTLKYIFKWSLFSQKII